MDDSIMFIFTLILILFGAIWGIPKLFMFFFNKLKKPNISKWIIPFALLGATLSFAGEVFLLWLIVQRIIKIS